MPVRPRKWISSAVSRVHAFDRPHIRPAVEMRRIARLHGEAQVLLDRYAREQVRDLERAGEARGNRAMRREPGDGRTGEHHAAAIGHEHPGDQIEYRRLAGAVGADQRVQRPRPNGEARIDDGLDAAERLGEVADFERGAFQCLVRLEECRQRQPLLDPAARHRGGLDDLRPHRLGEAPPDADEAGRRIDDESHEQQSEEQQPVRRPDRQELLEEDVEQRAERRAEQAAHPADDDHREQRAGERHSGRIRRREAMMEHGQHAGETAKRRGDRERDLLVPLRRIADELRALLVLADRDQHRSDRGAVEALERIDDADAQQRDQRVVDPRVLEIDRPARSHA